MKESAQPRQRGDIHILWLSDTLVLLSNRFDSSILVFPTRKPHFQIYTDTQRLFKGTIPLSSSTSTTSLLYNTFASYSLQPNQFWLFALDPSGQLYVCDLLCDVPPSSSPHSQRIRANSLPPSTRFTPVSTNGFHVSLAGVLSPPFHVRCVQSQSALFIAATVAGVSPTADPDDQLGIAAISIGNSSVVDSVRVETLAKNPITRHSSSFIARWRAFLRTPQGTDRIPAIHCLSIRGNGETAALVLSNGRVWIVDLRKGGVSSRYEEAMDDAQSAGTSIAALSVTAPLDVSLLNWAAWASEALLWVSNLQGNVGLLRVSDWENVLGEDGIQFAEGACVSSVETGSDRAFCLVLENPREWMRDLEGGHVIANAYALQSIEEVTPWEKFVRCIRSKEFGTALQLAKRLHFDEDLV